MNREHMYSSAVRTAMKKVRKGDVRNTVLRQIKSLRNGLKLLEQGKRIKESEIPEIKEEKVKGLRKHIAIIESGMFHMKHAIDELEKYKDVTVT